MGGRFLNVIGGGTSDLLRPDGVVRCPRKGTLADAIAGAKCVDLNRRSPHACAEYGCNQQQLALAAMDVRRHLSAKLDALKDPPHVPRLGSV